MDLYNIIGLAIIIVIAIPLVIIPTIKCSKNILKHNTADNQLPVQRYEIIGLIVMPVLGYLFLFLFMETAELLDWQYIFFVWLFTAISICFYFLSRTRKHTTGPLTLVFIPSALTTGIILAILQFIHFSPFIALGSMMVFTPAIFFTIFVLPAFFLLQAAILMAVELYCILQYNKQRVLNDTNKSEFINDLTAIYFGKYYLIAQIISFPIFITIVQVILMMFAQKPGGVIQAFIESHDGVFSKGACEHCVGQSTQEYLCTIAAFGSNNIVKPIHYGYRQGSIIRVNRQLKICNAFEEMMIERTPALQKCLRTFYDSLQIPIEKWKKIKMLSNTIYIIIKPMEWTFLIILYIFERDPETKIAKQYLPVNILSDSSTNA